MLTQTPRGLDEIIHTFGDYTQRNFESLQLTKIQLPYPLIYDTQQVVRVRCHRLVAEPFQQAFEEIKTNGLEDQAKHFGGIYAVRPIRGYNAHPSTHSWGIAIDLEPALYPLGSAKRFPQGVIDAFHKAGFFYGGDFKSRKDPMHFQFATNY